ncbi:ABC transporter substrate-binding protein [Glaciecola siphonariae]|uniref:ABC transporter substrate-binding protein n=1 Tax=Glaciecola siphonariae TaxID=521012 RepID=A0ABV9LZP6_9ALTE
MRRVNILKTIVRFIGISTALIALAMSVQAQDAATDTVIEVDRTDPYLMVQEVASKTFARIKREQAQIQQDPEVLRTIMEEELLPYIDYRFSAYKVLGKYARGVEKKDLLEFITVFRQYLITSYAVAMGYYDNQVVEFDPVRDYSDRSDVTVRAVIKDGSRPDIKVAFKVRKDRKGDEWQAYDMIAEGISLLSSKQSEFEAILRRDGIQEVISQMRASINQPITLNNDQAESNDSDAATQ